VGKTGIFWLPDMHSGSPWSLYPNKQLPLMNGPVGPNAAQKAIYRHWRECLNKVAEWRQGLDRLVVVNMGDAVEGQHHKNKEIVSEYLVDQQTIHRALMDECKEAVKWDTLYYINGTPAHAGEDEYNLAMVLGAELYRPGNATYPILRKTVEGQLIYAAHHGPGPGRGSNFGNPLRAKLRLLEMQLDRLRQPKPAAVFYAHAHVPTQERLYYSGGFIDGYILPSWKLPDGYVNKIDPFSWSNIGCAISTVTETGIETKFLTIHIEQTKVSAL
jgi:hypothetical protein